MKAKVLIPVGYGLNCEDETENAFRLAGGEVEKMFIKDLEKAPERILDYQIVVLVGGFAYADHVAAGTILKNKLKYSMEKELQKFVDDGRLIIGICNGFQVLVKIGLLPGFDKEYREQIATLTANASGKFEDRWIRVKANEKSNCIFTKGIKELHMPVRHGEGKFIADDSVLNRLEKENRVALRYCDEKTREPTMKYPDNPNGALRAIAGICNKEGNAFGLMPHPEATLNPYLNPEWPRLKVKGIVPDIPALQIFSNAVSHATENLV